MPRVKNQAAATRYCIQALGSWPEAYSAYNEVIFDYPGPRAQLRLQAIQ